MRTDADCVPEDVNGIVARVTSGQTGRTVKTTLETLPEQAIVAQDAI